MKQKMLRNCIATLYKVTPPISYPNPFVREKKVRRETSESGTWKKNWRENAFTSDFRIFHVSVSRFSLPAFFLHVWYWVVSRSILGCFTFDFGLFHVRFSRFSRHVFGSFAAEKVKWRAVIEFLDLYLIRGINPEMHAVNSAPQSRCRGCYPWSLLAKGMSRPNIPLNPRPNMRNPIMHEP